VGSDTDRARRGAAHDFDLESPETFFAQCYVAWLADRLHPDEKRPLAPAIGELFASL